MDKHDNTALQRVEAALDAAMIVLRNGGPTRMADRTLRSVGARMGLTGLSAAWRLDFAAAHCEVDGGAFTVVRPVGTQGINLARASEAAVFVERDPSTTLDPTAVRGEINRINAVTSPYKRWMTIVAAACAAGAFARIFGGDWAAVGIAVTSAACGQFVRTLLAARGLPAAAVTFLVALFSAFLSAAILRFGVHAAVNPALIGSVIYLVPGIPLINGFVDVISQKYLLVGLERLTSAAAVFILIAIGVASAYATLLLGHVATPFEPRDILSESLWAGVSAAAIALLLTAPPGHLASAFLCGAAARFVRDSAVASGLSTAAATAIAAGVVVLVAVTVLRGHAVSPVVLITGVLPLLANLTIIDSIVRLMGVASLEGAALERATGGLASNVAKVFVNIIAIAAGLSAGLVLVRLIRREKAWSAV